MRHIQEALVKYKIPKVNLLILSDTGLDYDEDKDCNEERIYHSLHFKHFTPETLIVGSITRPAFSTQPQQELIEILEKLEPTKNILIMWWIIGFIIWMLAALLMIRFVAVSCKSDVSEEEINKLKKKYNVNDNTKN